MAADELVSSKPSGLTLDALAQYDDLITDALVDQAYFWARIKKNKVRYAPARGLKEEEIADVIRKSIVIEKDPSKACARLNGFTAFQRFVQRLPGRGDREHFQRHLRRYVDMYLPDCSWEVNTTNRYEISKVEASVTARKALRTGDEIKYLTGITVPLTQEQVDSLDKTKLDFSIIVSQRNRRQSLFLGPARFANHDCDANARLAMRGSNGMAVIARKDIEIGDEITVSYGEDYFGIDNRECLCSTCEKLDRNGWNLEEDDDESEDGDEDTQAEDLTPRQLANIRQRRSDGRFQPSATPSATGGSQSASPNRLIEGSRTRRQQDANRKTPSRSGPSTPRGRSMAAGHPQHTPSHLATMITADDLGQGDLTLPPLRLHSTSSERSISHSTGQGDAHSGTEATSATGHSPPQGSFQEKPAGAEDAPIIIKQEFAEPEVVPFPAHNSIPPLGQSFPSREPTTTLREEIMRQLSVVSQVPTYPGQMCINPSDPGVSSLLDTAESTGAQVIPVTNIPALAASSTLTTVETINMTGSDLLASDASQKESKLPRRPGDWTLQNRLLALPSDRWNECHACDTVFIQQDAYQTRVNCPRCERHSKLYGYQWPKTDKINKYDTEVRILDHRTINRFVAPDDERAIAKGKSRSLQRLLQSRLQQQSSDREASELEEFHERARVSRRAGKRTTFYGELPPEPSEEEEQPRKKRKYVHHVVDPNEDEAARARRMHKKLPAYASPRNNSTQHRPNPSGPSKAKAARRQSDSAVVLKATAAKTGRPRKLKPMPDSDDDEEEDEDDEDSLSAKASPNGKRKYVRSGKYVGRHARRQMLSGVIKPRALKSSSSSSCAGPESKPRWVATGRVSKTPDGKRKYVRSGKYSKKNSKASPSSSSSEPVGSADSSGGRPGWLGMVQTMGRPAAPNKSGKIKPSWYYVPITPTEQAELDRKAAARERRAAEKVVQETQQARQQARKAAEKTRVKHSWHYEIVDPVEEEEEKRKREQDEIMGLARLRGKSRRRRRSSSDDEGDEDDDGGDDGGVENGDERGRQRSKGEDEAESEGGDEEGDSENDDDEDDNGSGSENEEEEDEGDGEDQNNGTGIKLIKAADAMSSSSSSSSSSSRAGGGRGGGVVEKRRSRMTL